MLMLAEVNWEAIINPNNTPIAAIVMVVIVGTAAVLGGIWYAVKKHEAEVRLKRDLVAKGYTADDIERILQAKQTKD